MLYREISPSFVAQRYSKFPSANEDIPLLGETKLQCFKRHLSRNRLKVGQYVRFKKPKRNPVYGRITHIEEDFEKVTWSHKGTSPAYIHVAIERVNKSTGEINVNTVKTHEGKLLFALEKTKKTEEHAYSTDRCKCGMVTSVECLCINKDTDDDNEVYCG